MTEDSSDSSTSENKDVIKKIYNEFVFNPEKTEDINRNLIQTFKYLTGVKRLYILNKIIKKYKHAMEKIRNAKFQKTNLKVDNSDILLFFKACYDTENTFIKKLENSKAYKEAVLLASIENRKNYDTHNFKRCRKKRKKEVSIASPSRSFKNIQHLSKTESLNRLKLKTDFDLKNAEKDPVLEIKQSFRSKKITSGEIDNRCPRNFKNIERNTPTNEENSKMHPEIDEVDHSSEISKITSGDKLRDIITNVKNGITVSDLLQVKQDRTPKIINIKNNSQIHTNPINVKMVKSTSMNVEYSKRQIKEDEFGPLSLILRRACEDKHERGFLGIKHNINPKIVKSAKIHIHPENLKPVVKEVAGPSSQIFRSTSKEKHGTGSLRAKQNISHKNTRIVQREVAGPSSQIHSNIIGEPLDIVTERSSDLSDKRSVPLHNFFKAVADIVMMIPPHLMVEGIDAIRIIINDLTIKDVCLS